MRPSLETIKQKKDLIGAEIGVQFGINAFDILMEMDIKKLYLIDPYLPFPNASNNMIPTEVEGPNHKQMIDIVEKKLEKFNNKIVWIRKFSYDAYGDIPDGELDFVYIDGDHRTEILKKDIILYTPKVKIGGLIAGHDMDFDYVEKGVKEMYSDYKTGGSDWWVVKR